MRAAGEALATPESGTLDILVVEDSPDHAELIARIFASAPMPGRIRICRTLSEAGAQLREAMPDLVVCDMRLPDGSGADLLEDASVDVPVVLMTSYGDEGQAVTAIKSGAQDYVVKNESNFAALPDICSRAHRAWRAHQDSIRAQQALARSEARYRALFENVPAGIFGLDENGRIETANPAMARMLGLRDATELVGLRFPADLVAGSFDTSDLMDGLASQDSGESSELELRHADGGSVVVLAKARRAPEPGDGLELFCFDITARKRSEAALAETRLRLEATFRNVAGFIAILDKDGRVMDVSDSVLAAGGASREELLGLPFDDMPWRRGLAGEREAVRKGLASAASGKTHSDQTSHRGADGSMHTSNRSFTAVRDAAGEVSFYVVEGSDVTDLLNANEALERSEARYRVLFENAPEAIVIMDMERGFVDVNSNAETLFGMPREDLIGKDPIIMSPPFQPDRSISREAAAHYLRAAVAGQKPVFEWTHRTASGEDVPCEVRLVRLPDPGKILIRGSITDISERKRAEARVREGRRRMAALVENASAGILELDPRGCILSANPAAVTILGQDRDSEVTGTLLAGFACMDDRAWLEKAVSEASAGDDSSGTFCLGEPDRQRILAASFSGIRDEDGGVARVMVMCDDITERAAYEARLREEKDFTAAVINSLPGTFYVYSEDGRLIRFNERFLQISGYTASEARDMGPLDLFDAENAAIVADGMRSVLSAGEARVVADMTARDGQRHTFSLNGSLLEREGNKYIVGVGIDITEQVQSEKRLREEMRFSETVINAMPGVFYVVNEQRRIVRWNDNLLSLLGFSADEVAALEPMRIIAEQDRASLRKAIDQVFESGEARSEASIITADGSQVPFLFTGVRLRSAHGTYMVGMGFDISERRQFEAQLRESENYLRSVVESEPECVWTLDARGKLVDINPAGRLLLGDPSLEVATRSSVIDLVIPEHRDAFENLNKSVFAGHSGILTFAIETLSGGRRWLETHAVALKNSLGKVRGHLAVTRDITAKRDADRKIRDYSERLRTLSRRLIEIQEAERRHVARELHDEVGQSLTALKLELEAAVGKLGEEQAVEMLESLRIVERVLAQIRDMSLDLRPAILDDLGLLPALRWYADKQAARSGLQIRLAADSLTGVRLDPAVETAGFRITQEALNNALRHARPSRVDIELDLDDTSLRLKVTDDGEGFDSRSWIRRSAMGGSFGLTGLQERAILLGGQARITSEAGEGTVVRAELPLKGLPRDPESRAAAEPEPELGRAD